LAKKSRLSKEDRERLQPLLLEFGEAVHQAVGSSPEIADLFERISAATKFVPFFFIEAKVGFAQSESETEKVIEPVPLVKNGEVIPEAFTTDDRAFMKRLKIDLSLEE
jgi:hypothetical protein